MKTLLQISLLIITTMMFFSCQKWKQVSVEGNIYEYGTDEPVENATVSLFEFVANELGGSYYFIDSVHTNANGYYEYHNLDEDMLYVSLEVKKENYFTIDYYNPIEYYFFVNQDDVTMNVTLDPEAYLTLELIDSPKIDSYGVYINCDYVTLYGKTYFEDSILEGTVKGNRYNEIFMKFVNDTSEIIKNDSIYLKSFEQKTYTIEF